MSKKLFAFLLAVVMVVSLLAVHTFASALNPAGGCTTETAVKRAAPGAVVHDGIISPGEYTDIEINRSGLASRKRVRNAEDRSFLYLMG